MLEPPALVGLRDVDIDETGAAPLRDSDESPIIDTKLHMPPSSSAAFRSLVGCVSSPPCANPGKQKTLRVPKGLRTPVGGRWAAGARLDNKYQCDQEERPRRCHRVDA